MALSKNNMVWLKQAFTMVELMVTCVIIALLIALAAPSFLRARLKAEEQKGIATLHEFAKAQTAYWFDHEGTPIDPNTYTNSIFDLTPSYVDIPTDDGDWIYNTTGDTTSFTVTATHLDGSGTPDGLTLQIDKSGTITKGGAWPY